MARIEAVQVAAAVGQHDIGQRGPLAAVKASAMVARADDFLGLDASEPFASLIPHDDDARAVQHENRDRKRCHHPVGKCPVWTGCNGSVAACTRHIGSSGCGQPTTGRHAAADRKLIWNKIDFARRH